jgi:DNA-binding MltR family transcriptional regulator
MAKKSAKPSRSPSAARAVARSKHLLKDLPTLEKMEEVLYGLKLQGHSAAALLGTAYLENALKALITTAFRELDKDDYPAIFDGSRNGILGTFNAKIRIAYAMKLIGQTLYWDLLLISTIRNVFAHSLHQVTFDHDDVKSDCKNLKARNAAQKAAGIQEFGPPKEPIDLFLDSVWTFYRDISHEVERRLGVRSELPIPAKQLFANIA